MKKVIEEIKAITADAVAKKQEIAKNGYHNLINKITLSAKEGNYKCEFSESEIDSYSKKLLEDDGFRVYSEAISQDRYSQKNFYPFHSIPKIKWIVKW